MTSKANWAHRLNAALFPWIGPPPLGPYGEPELPPVSGMACPLCERPMSEHTTTKREGRPTLLHCPRELVA